MDPVDNNQFEVIPTTKSKRKFATPNPNAYLNPALDLLANEDPICNTAMEIVPVKKRKRTQSDIAAFENSALDLGISKAAVNEFLVRELENVRKNLRPFDAHINPDINLSVLDANIDSFLVPEPVIADKPKIDAKNVVVEPSRHYKENNTPVPLESVSNIAPKIDLKNVSMENVPLKTEIHMINDMSVPLGEPRVENVASTEPIYANLTDISIKVPDNLCIENPNPGCTFDDISNNFEASYIDEAGNVQNCMETSTIPSIVESKFDDSINCTEISTIDNEIDSGISVLEHKSLNTLSELQNNDLSAINNTTNIQTNVTNQIFVNNTNNLSLSFIDRLALDSPNISNQSLYLDDDLNESNIMEIKTITIITKKKRIPSLKKNTNPFLEPNLNSAVNITEDNPFLDPDLPKPELEYSEEVLNRPDHLITQIAHVNPLMPRRLFANDTNSTYSTVNESSLNVEQHDYENIDGYRSESPVYENIGEEINEPNINKQSKILGHDVSRFSAVDIMNINKSRQGNSSNESNESKKDLKHHILKASNKLSKKVLKTLRKTFKTDKPDHNVTLNPYEVPRKPPKQKNAPKESGIENPCLNLDNSDEIEIEELDDDEEHQYETIKTIRNTRLNMNVTPLREKSNEIIDTSHNKTNTPGKKVRFDSTLNQEKIITGNSFDYGLQSPGFDAKIDKFHDELENCINERKFLEQNM